MANSRSQNTMSEGLVALMQQLTDMKLTPDADIEWIIGMETQVMQKAREPFDQLKQGGGNPGGMPMPQGPGGAVGAPMMPGPAGVPGGAANAPDELRRALGG